MQSTEAAPNGFHSFDPSAAPHELMYTRVAKHLFCSECGIKAFYRPRSNPDGWSVNARCLDSLDGVTLQVEAFDGQNWEANASGLAHLSRESA